MTPNFKLLFFPRIQINHNSFVITLSFQGSNTSTTHTYFLHNDNLVTTLKWSKSSFSDLQRQQQANPINTSNNGIDGCINNRKIRFPLNLFADQWSMIWIIDFLNAQRWSKVISILHKSKKNDLAQLLHIRVVNDIWGRHMQSTVFVPGNNCLLVQLIS